MRASRRVNATVLATTVMSLLFAFACSGGDEPTSVTAPPQAPDAAAAAQPDGGDAAISESSIPQTTAEPPPAPVGAKLLVGGDVFLLGTTNDGFALYIANSYGDGPLYAVSLAGGAPIQLAPFVHFSDVIIQGNGVAFWTGVALNPLRGTLNLWTQATGLRPNLGMTVADAAYFSDDGSRVAFFVNPRPLASPPRVDLAVTNVAAPSLAPVISDLNQDPDTDLAPTCTPHLRYVGPLLYTAYCTVDRPLQSVFRAVSAAGVVTTIIDNTVPANGVQSDFSLDATAQKAFFVGTNREARVLTMANGSTTVLDTNVVSGTGIISADGSTALYVKEIPPVSEEDVPYFTLRRSPTAAPSPVTLHDAFGSLLASTASLATALFTVSGVLPDGRSDLYLLDTIAPPGPPTTLSALTTASPVGFTQDGTQLLYLSDVGGSSGQGTLVVRNVATGAERTVSNKATRVRLAATGTKVVFCESPVQAAAPGDHSTCNIASFDAATSAAATVVVQKADPYFFSAGTQLVFALMWGPSRGIYVKDAP